MLMPSVTLYVARFGSATPAWFEQAERGLCAAERRRMPKHERGGAWRRHVLSRRLMRFAAMTRLRRENAQIDYPEDSAPRLRTGSPTGLGISMSHCCETAAVAIAEHATVGCDILSSTRRLRWQHIASAFFDETDYAWMMDSPGAARARFNALWCAKEAIAKCSGKPLLECLRYSTTPGSASRYWTRTGTLADCTYAVASDRPLAVAILEVPLDALQSETDTEMQHHRHVESIVLGE